MTSAISACADRELTRRAKHKLAVLRHVDEVSGSVAATCRYFGISRQAYYKWRNRFEEEGVDGLRDRSSAPHHSPTTHEPGTKYPSAYSFGPISAPFRGTPSDERVFAWWLVGRVGRSGRGQRPSRASSTTGQPMTSTQTATSQRMSGTSVEFNRRPNRRLRTPRGRPCNCRRHPRRRLSILRSPESLRWYPPPP